VERGLDTAEAEAGRIGGPGTGPDRAGASGRAGAEREQLEGAIRRGEQELARLQRRMRTAAPAQRRALEREALARRNQLDLDRVRFDFIARLGAADSSLSARNDDDLAHRIQALHDAVPELASGAAPAAPRARRRARLPPRVWVPGDRSVACSLCSAPAGVWTTSRPPPAVSSARSTATSRPSGTSCIRSRDASVLWPEIPRPRA